MNLDENLMITAMEECAEVAQRVSKALRFGVDDVQPGQPLDNRERIIGEWNHLICTMRILGFHIERPEIQAAKLEQLARYQVYSRHQGTLAP